MRILYFLYAVTTLAIANAAPGQTRALLPDSGYTFERQTRERWLNGSQQSAFTSFTYSQQWAQIDSVRVARAPGGRVFYLSLPGYIGGRTSALVTTNDRGSVTSVNAILAKLRQTPRDVVDSARLTRMQVFENFSDSRLSLPETRVWDLVPALGVSRPVAGARWLDTISLTATLGGYRQALHGVRASTIIGDTVADGRRLWLVRDSASVHYEERALIQERTLDTMVAVERTAQGFIVGRHLYDDQMQLFRIRHDTTSLAGEAVLRYPDGRKFRTPVRYERTRRIDLHNRTESAARRAALKAMRGDFSIVERPEGLVERLAVGDSTLRDSLVAVWSRSRDPEQRDSLHRLLTTWGRSHAGFGDRLHALALESGDTARVVAELAKAWVYPGRPTDAAAYRLLLPFMVDPGKAFAFGVDRDPFYENAAQALLTRPPAVTADTLRWPCTPEVCRSLAAEWQGTREPRLRELGLVARLTLEPARWSDTVLARHASGSAFLRDAALLARGVGAAWPAAAKAEIPSSEAGWREWSRWMSGRDPRYSHYGPAEPVRFEASHTVAIRFYEARTGRDVVAELKAKSASAESDSARLIFGAMLLGLGEATVRDPADIASAFRSGSPASRHLAIRELRVLFRMAKQPADSATAVELYDRFLRVVMEGADLWSTLGGAASGGGWAKPHRLATAGTPIVIPGDSLPRALHAPWMRRGALVVDSKWRLPSSQSAIVITPTRATQVGAFVRIGIRYDNLSARVAGRGRSHSGSWTLYLMQTDAGWVIVTTDSWIT